jgi:hypothetical protein
MRDMDARFVSVAGKGDGSLLVNEGLLRNLPFRDFDATLSLTPDEQMSVSKVYMSTAKGGLDLTGDVSLLTSRGEFDAQGKSLDVGYIARGLAGERGFSGTGDFQAHFTGHLHSLLAANRPVSSSGQFELREGQVRPVENLESKLNLANLIFGGPFALNVNNLMELLAPSNRGSYDSLAGSWQLTDEIVQLPEIRYRGSNGLKLNLSGLWHRARGDVNFRIIGSYPKVPVRVNDEGEVIPVWEVIAGLHPASLLKRVGIFEPEPHAFAFDMRGNIANPVRLEGTAASTFRFLEGDYSRRELPHPEQPSLVQ